MKKWKHYKVVSGFILCFILGTTAQAKELVRVAVAANVSYAMSELEVAFEKQNPDIDLSVILGSSGKLTAQITNGAPYDLFLSANMKYPETLHKNGMAITEPKIYAQGQIIFFSKKDLSKYKKQLLEHGDFKKIACANFRTAPYGKAAMQYLENTQVKPKIQHKLLFAESISQTLQYSMTAADGGFIAKSAIYSPKLTEYNKQGIHWIDLDNKKYTPINQGIVLLKRAKNNSNAKKVYDFFISQEASIILKKYGYNIPNSKLGKLNP